MTHPTTLPPSEGQSRFAISLALVLLRLMMGWIFIYIGAGKLFGAFGGFGMKGWIGAMETMHMPLLSPVAWAYISACSEFFCGVLIFLGLLTRLAALPLIATMAVAIIKVTGVNGFGGVPQMDGSVFLGYAYNLTLLVIAVALVLTGAGLISLDALIFRRGLWSRGPQPLRTPEQKTM